MCSFFVSIRSISSTNFFISPFSHSYPLTDSFLTAKSVYTFVYPNDRMHVAKTNHCNVCPERRKKCRKNKKISNRRSSSSKFSFNLKLKSTFKSFPNITLFTDLYGENTGKLYLSSCETYRMQKNILVIDYKSLQVLNHGQLFEICGQ